MVKGPGAQTCPDNKRHALLQEMYNSVDTLPITALPVSAPPLVKSEILAVASAEDFKVKNSPVLNI